MIYSLASKNKKRKKISFITALILLFVFSNSFLFDEVMRLWEVPAVRYEDLNVKYDAGIVLGGMLGYDKILDRIQFYKGADRLLQAIELYKRGYIKKILFVGGSGSIIYKDVKEGVLVERYLLTLGIPPEDILIENESRNTRENALFSKEVLKQSLPQVNKFLLITSAFHMRRSMGCFKKVGIPVEPYSTDRFSGKRKFVIDHCLIPNAGVLASWDALTHELVGFIAYKIAGYV